MNSSFRNLTEPLIETPRERSAPACVGMNVLLDGPWGDRWVWLIRLPEFGAPARRKAGKSGHRSAPVTGEIVESFCYLPGRWP